MKNIVLTIAFFSLVLTAKSQNASVEKSVFGIQTGSFGIWGHSELKLANQIALRGELGFDINNGKSDFYPDTSFLLTSVITVEPRWYYNLNKRESKSKQIDGNNGNFFSLKTSYHPDLLVVSNSDESINVVTDISIIPTWGIRRNIGKYFNYETGIGVGYIHYFAKNEGFPKDKGETAINLHLRIGYRF